MQRASGRMGDDPGITELIYWTLPGSLFGKSMPMTPTLISSEDQAAQVEDPLGNFLTYLDDSPRDAGPVDNPEVQVEDGLPPARLHYHSPGHRLGVPETFGHDPHHRARAQGRNSLDLTSSNTSYGTNYLVPYVCATVYWDLFELDQLTDPPYLGTAS